MATLRLILGDQLCHELSSLSDCRKASDRILMCEVADEATYVKHHKKKIVLLFSAMRHFAAELRARGFRVDYVTFDDPKNTGSFTEEIARSIKQRKFDRIVVTHPGEYRVLKAIKSWQKRFELKVEIREDDRFLCPLEEFRDWAEGRKRLRMEHFYRKMRSRYSILMDGSRPEGGKWNYDSENRKPPKTGLRIPAFHPSPADRTTRKVMKLVAAEFADHFGDLNDFQIAVTRDQALDVLEHFIAKRLAHFGDYQDAMLQGEPWMYHSHISFYLNCGLLRPLECVETAESAYRDGRAPLNAVEGFIRQIVGWREFVRGIYWLKMPGYAEENYFGAGRNLPDFYWSGDTKMNCMAQCLAETREHAYAHHIQRLMVLGNFSLLAAIDPKAVQAWYLSVYADAYEWVELPNVNGMILYADGGKLASKPYASGGAYINRMSNYCGPCAYRVSQKSGRDACPFNYLYWNFLLTNRAKLSDNPRLAMMYRTLDRMDEKRIKTVKTDSRQFLRELDHSEKI